MAHKLDTSDFRALRTVLDPSDFAISSGVDALPTDLIAEKSWKSIMTLPEDVSITTTSHQGSRIELLNELWGGWVESMPTGGIISNGMLEAESELQCAIFNLIHGFYRQSVASLRNLLEIIIFACKCELTTTNNKWNSWEKGDAQIRFSDVCRELAENSHILAFEKQAIYLTGTSIFYADGVGNPWAKDIYARLSRYSHSRGDSTNNALWQSNGPVYSSEGMKITYEMYLETYALLMLLIKLSDNKFVLPDQARILYLEDCLKLYLKKPFLKLCAFYHKSLYIE
jgi:hypothetical protein